MIFTAEIESSLYEAKGCYICICDLDQKESKEIETPNGNVKLYTPQKYNNNHRTAHPNIGTIIQTIGECQFGVGDEIMCTHFTFEKENKTPNHFFEQDGIKYYKVYSGDVLFKLSGEDLIPREGIVLSEPIFDKLISTTLELSGSLNDYRRDVVKVIKSWEGCEDYKTGDYLLLEKGGDYHFSYNGKDYVKSDDYFDDIIAVIDSPEWRTKELLLHAKGHSELTDKTL